MTLRLLTDREIEQLSAIAADIDPGVMVITGEFVDPVWSGNYITTYAPGVWEHTTPQPVSMSPGALGVRVGE